MVKNKQAMDICLEDIRILIKKTNAHRKLTVITHV